MLSDRPPKREFRPALEVDALRWPAAVTQLVERYRDQLDPLCEALEHARARRERVVVFQSTGTGSGCTTYVLSAARLLAAEGRSVAIVDAEFFRPQLAPALGLAVGEGWEGTLVSGADLAESVIWSLADGIAVVPLVEPLREAHVSGAAFLDQVAAALDLLAAHFDMVLVDAGCPEDSSEKDAVQSALAATAQAAVFVLAEHLPSADGGQRHVGLSLPVIGIVENFVEADRRTA